MVSNHTQGPRIERAWALPALEKDEQTRQLIREQIQGFVTCRIEKRAGAVRSPDDVVYEGPSG